MMAPWHLTLRGRSLSTLNLVYIEDLWPYRNKQHKWCCWTLGVAWSISWNSDTCMVCVIWESDVESLESINGAYILICFMVMHHIYIYYHKFQGYSGWPFWLCPLWAWAISLCWRCRVSSRMWWLWTWIQRICIGQTLFRRCQCV